MLAPPPLSFIFIELSKTLGSKIVHLVLKSQHYKRAAMKIPNSPTTPPCATNRPAAPVEMANVLDAVGV